MKIGKVPENILKRSVLKQCLVKRDEVLVHTGIGEDCAMFAVEPDEIIVLSTDPITGTVNNIGSLAVHVTANDIATSGAQLIGMLLTIILPKDSDEQMLKEIMGQVSQLTKKYNIEIMGGHTEVSAAVNQPIISVTGVGKVKKDNQILTGGMKAGNDIVMTKWAGLEGTAIIAKDKETQLRQHFHQEFIDEAQGFANYLSVVEEAQIAVATGTTTAMHDVTEGGIFGALWEMASASHVGLTVDLKKIPIRQETIEISEIYDINPYMLISSGSMLIGTSNGPALVEELRKNGIDGSVIGRASEGNDKIVINGEEQRYLEPPKEDHLYKAFI